MPRKSSIIRGSIYALPAIMDMVQSLLLFVCQNLAADAGASSAAVAGVVSVWGVLYMISCPVVGRFITRERSATMLIVSCLATIVLCVILLFVHHVNALFVLIALVAVANSLFFAPFQVFMAAVDEGQKKPITYSTGLYTFSWSMGFAAGPFVAGFLWGLPEVRTDSFTVTGWQWSVLIAVAALVVNIIGVAALKRYGDAAHAETDEHYDADDPPVPPPLDYSKRPNFAWLAWIGAGIGIFVLQGVRGIFPKYTEALDIGKDVQGTALCLISFAQGMTGLFLCRSRNWMYRPRHIALFGAAGMAGLVVVGLGGGKIAFYAGACLFGVYAGSFFYYFVFHALAHPDKAPRQVAMNEMVVGMCGIFGPLLAGTTADLIGARPDAWNIRIPILAGVALVAGALLFKRVMHHRHAPEHARGEE